MQAWNIKLDEDNCWSKLMHVKDNIKLRIFFRNKLGALNCFSVRLLTSKFSNQATLCGQNTHSSRGWWPAITVQAVIIIIIFFVISTLIFSLSSQSSLLSYSFFSPSSFSLYSPLPALNWTSIHIYKNEKSWAWKQIYSRTRMVPIIHFIFSFDNLDVMCTGK